MRLRPTALTAASLVVALCGLAGEAAAPAVVVALGGLDPVALLAGQEVAGNPELSAERGLYRYQFANEENRARFLAAPADYSIQLGGACARMGPLSGLGSPERFLVSGGKIYLFASDACRKAFAQAPENFLAPASEPLTGTAQARAKAQKLLAKALATHGGAAAFSALGGYQVSSKLRWPQEGKTYEGSRRQTVVFPSHYHAEEVWDGSRSGHGFGPLGAFRFAGDETWLVEEDVAPAILAELYHQPIALLAMQAAPGFEAVARGGSARGERALELVEVRYRGVRSMLGLDPASGRIETLSYRGRGPAGLADVELAFADYRLVGGVLLPHAVEERRNGERVQLPEVVIESIQRAKPDLQTLFTPR